MQSPSLLLAPPAHGGLGEIEPSGHVEGDAVPELACAVAKDLPSVDARDAHAIESDDAVRDRGLTVAGSQLVKVGVANAGACRNAGYRQRRLRERHVLRDATLAPPRETVAELFVTIRTTRRCERDTQRIPTSSDSSRLIGL